MCAERMDLSRDEAKRILRRLELEAYSSIVSAFRAQGDLSRDKKKILHELGSQLSISTERHRAEVRRAYSDDRLGIVAECIYGPGSCVEWVGEGRRLVPLMPRLVPQTVFSATATAAANSAAATNAKLLASSKAAGKLASGKTSASSAQPSSSTSSSGSTSITAAKSAASRQVPSSAGSQTNSAENYDDDGKPKKRRRLSVTSPKTVQKIAVTSVVVKPLQFTKTATVSTMTKVGKPTTASAPSKVTPRGTLPASASQVKLLTKTVAITQTVCQAKTLLSYKTMTTTSPSGNVKAQSVMTNTTPKSQVKVAVPSATPVSKVVMVAKSQGSSNSSGNQTSKSTQGVAGKPSGSLLTVTKSSATGGDVTAKQKGKHVTTAARFKPLPGTVKFKSVSPATMGTCSTVTMVTPSPSLKSAGASLTASSTQPLVRLIQVPSTGGVGASKPLVVMTTGLPKTIVPGGSTAGKSRAVQPATGGEKSAPTSTSTTQSTTKVTVSSAAASVFKPVSSLAQRSKQATQLPTTSSKTVLLTTMVGGNKKVMLSVPASCSAALSKSITIAPSQGTAPTAPPMTDVQPPIAPIQDQGLLSLESVPPLGISSKPATMTTSSQARSRALPTLLPAPPKISLADLQAGQPPGGLRKLATILPAPAKVAVIPTMLVPVVSTSSTTQSALVRPSAPVAVTSTTSSTVSVTSSVEEQHATARPDETTRDQLTGASSAEPATLFDLFQQVPACTDEEEVEVAVGEGGGVEHGVAETPSEIPVVQAQEGDSKAETPAQGITEADNNTSSEDDSLLLCSETIDSTPALPNLSPTPEVFKSTQAADGKPLPIQSTEEAAFPDISIDTPADRGSGASSVSSELEIAAPSKDGVHVQSDSSSLSPNVVPGSIEQPSFSAKVHNPEVQSSLEDKEVERTFFEVCREDSPRLSPDEISSATPTSDTVENREDKGASGSLPNLMDENLSPDSSFKTVYNTAGVDHVSHKGVCSSGDAQTAEDEQALRSTSVCSGSSSGTSTGEVNVMGEETSLSCSHSSQLDSLQEGLWHDLDKSGDSSSATASTPSVSSISPENRDTSEASVRTSGRKRKPPTMAERSPSRQVNSWVRGALSLLQRVSTYRGQGRRKGNFSAASWFLKPVDPVDAPGYDKIVKLPMDFGTVKLKLECGEYPNYSDFHADMKLIKSNCYKYNPPGHDVRQDCDEVFRFYEAEYAKMIERWEKCHVSPAKKAKLAPKTLEGSK